MSSWQSTSTGLGTIGLPPITPVVKVIMIVWAGLWVLTFGLAQADPAWVLGSAPGADGDLVPTGLFGWLGATPARWFTEAPWFPVWQPLTYGLLHSANGVWHLLGNLLFVYFFGTLVEGIVGSRRFASFFVLAIVLAGVFSILSKAALGEWRPTVGGSGGVLAVVVAAAVFRPQTPVLLLFIPVPLMWLAIGVVAIDVVGAIQQINGYGGVQDNWAHLAGAAFGFLAARRGWLWIDWTEKVEEKVEQRRASSRAADEARLDELLERIRHDGLASLTERERAFLKRMSESKRGGGPG